jgi:hypothetical protein
MTPGVELTVKEKTILARMLWCARALRTGITRASRARLLTAQASRRAIISCA